MTYYTAVVWLASICGFVWDLGWIDSQRYGYDHIVESKSSSDTTLKQLERLAEQAKDPTDANLMEKAGKLTDDYYNNLFCL